MYLYFDLVFETESDKKASILLFTNDKISNRHFRPAQQPRYEVVAQRDKTLSDLNQRGRYWPAKKSRTH